MSWAIRNIANLFSGFPTTATAGNVHVPVPVLQTDNGSGRLTEEFPKKALFAEFCDPSVIVVSMLAGWLGSSVEKTPPTMLD
jgi:hypothetical protein